MSAMTQGRKISIALSCAAIIGGILFFVFSRSEPDRTIPAAPDQSERSFAEEGVEAEMPAGDISTRNFSSPLDNAAARVIKKPFGIFITKENSPVQPERFGGYHTGADFEVFPQEEIADVIVRAVCAGTVRLKKSVSGYGGVLVQECVMEREPFTVVYGHMDLSSISVAVGAKIARGEEIGILGDAYSAETDAERKHLHLGFHTGSAIELRGYVQARAELAAWMDPCDFICDE